MAPFSVSRGILCSQDTMMRQIIDVMMFGRLIKPFQTHLDQARVLMEITHPVIEATWTRTQ